MKNFIKYILQKTFGYRRYLYFFALFKIRTLKRDKKEGDFFKFLEEINPENGDIIDLGANIGVMTFHLSKRFPTNNIHAFEPMPDNLSVLNKVVNKYNLSNVEIHANAVGEKDGTVTMILPNNQGVKMQGLSHVKHESISEWNEGDEIEVDVVKLDNVLSEKKISAIKMDIENYEYFALTGAEQILKEQHPVIYTELWDNQNRTNCFNYLNKFNYTPYIIKEGNLVEYTGETEFQNFIFLVHS